MEERGAIVLTCEERFEEFEIADGDLVEFEGGGVLLEADGFDVRGVEFLCGAQVVEDGADGDGGGGVIGEAEAVEGVNVELALDEGAGEIVGTDPIVEAGAGGDALELGGDLGACGDEEFAGAGF